MKEYTFKKQFGDNLVELFFFEHEEDNMSISIDIAINGMCTRDVSNVHKVAITKWLLQEWKGLSEWYSSARCLVYQDKDYTYRSGIYKKIGFVPIIDEYDEEVFEWSK